MPMTSPFMLTSGPPRVAAVDGRVRLDEVLVAAVAQAELAAFGADDSRRDGVLHAQRIADGQDPFADLDLGRIAQLGEGQVLGLDLDQGHIGPRIGPDDLGLVFVALGGEDFDFLAVLDDVVVGDGVAVGADEKARPLDGHFLGLGPRLGAAEETIPKIVGRAVRECPSVDLSFDLVAFDLEDGRADLVRDLDEIQVGLDGLGGVGEEAGAQGRRCAIQKAPLRSFLLGQINKNISGQQDPKQEAGQRYPDNLFHRNDLRFLS